MKLNEIQPIELVAALKSRKHAVSDAAFMSVAESTATSGWRFDIERSTGSMLLFESARWQRFAGNQDGDFATLEIDIADGYMRVECFDGGGAVCLNTDDVFNLTGFMRSRWKEVFHAEIFLLAFLKAADITSAPFCKERSGPLLNYKETVFIGYSGSNYQHEKAA